LLPTWLLECNTGANLSSSAEVLVASPQTFAREVTSLPRLKMTPLVLVDDWSTGEFLRLPSDANVRSLVFLDDPPETLALGIATAATRGVWIPQSVWRNITSFVADRLMLGYSEVVRALTVAEKETLRLVAHGLSDREIADARHVA